MLSARYYRMLAGVLRDARHIIGENDPDPAIAAAQNQQQHGVDAVERLLVQQLAMDNGRFDRERFEQASQA